MPEKTHRQLAAIMPACHSSIWNVGRFTDIVGYTELMGKDEDQAFQLLRKNRNIQRPLIKNIVVNG